MAQQLPSIVNAQRLFHFEGYAALLEFYGDSSGINPLKETRSEFFVDGEAFGAPVSVVDGTATSDEAMDLPRLDPGLQPNAETPS